MPFPALGFVEAVFGHGDVDDFLGLVNLVRRLENGGKDVQGSGDCDSRG